MRVFYVSDLHLRDPAGPGARRFQLFLEQLPKPGDLLVLGGDIFDLFVGNKRVFREKFAGVLGALGRCAQGGITVHYLEGNHDFHLDGLFRGTGNMHIHAEEFALTAGGARIWVSHGDLIDEEDRGYRLLRAVTRSAPFRSFLATVPGGLIHGLGSWSSRQSRKYHDPERIDTRGQDRLRRIYLDFAREKVRSGYQYILVGHSHLADQVAIQEGNLSGEYVNLGYSSESLPYAVLDPSRASGRFELKAYL